MEHRTNIDWSLARWLRGKESACQYKIHRRRGLDPLEKEMATHSSIYAWRIPWTEAPGGYSPWCHKVGHNCTSMRAH